jgi:serine/threonine protein kinase
MACATVAIAFHSLTVDVTSDRQVIHLDLAPSNIVMDPDLNGLVIDFHVSKKLEQISAADTCLGRLQYLSLSRLDGRRPNISGVLPNCQCLCRSCSIANACTETGSSQRHSVRQRGCTCLYAAQLWGPCLHSVAILRTKPCFEWFGCTCEHPVHMQPTLQGSWSLYSTA